MQISSYVTSDMIFKDTSKEYSHFRDLVSRLSCSDALFWCARINLALGSVGNEKAQGPLFNMLTTRKEKYWLQKTFRRRSKKEGTPSIIFFRGQMLELIRWIVLCCDDHSNDGSTFDDEETKVLFFKCVLMASDIWEKQTFGAALEAEQDPLGIILQARAPFRIGVEAARNSPNLEVSFGRGWIFYQRYFSKYYPCFNEDFLSATGLTFEDYMVCFSAVALHFIDPLNKPCIIDKRTLGDTTKIPEKINMYVRLESQTLEELRLSLWDSKSADEINEDNMGSLNNRPIREKPMYSAPDGRTVVMDPIYFHERVLTSPMFHMIPLKRKTSNEIFAAFGYAFEDYCCDILERMYPSTGNNILMRNEEYHKNGENLQIDSVIKQNSSAILFEIKASFIKESEVNLDGVSFTEELRLKYSNSIKDGKEKVKGVGQLSRTIKQIVEQRFDKLSADFQGIGQIFPVLLVHDNLLDTPLTVDLLRDDFLQLLERDLGYPVNNCQIKIHVLTIMTIDHLENLEQSVKHFNMIDLLRKFVRGRTVSLNSFMSNSHKYGFYRNTHLINTSLEILEKTKTQLFNSID